MGDDGLSFTIPGARYLNGEKRARSNGLAQALVEGLKALVLVHVEKEVVEVARPEVALWPENRIRARQHPVLLGHADGPRRFVHVEQAEDHLACGNALVAIE